MTDYQDALVLENLDLVNWVIRTRISIPNRPLLTYDDYYAIGCEAICRAALKYQPDMKPLTPEQQAFAEEHHGLLLDFMAKHSLGDDYYDLLANRYLKVVVRYLSEESLRKYSFSTVVWYHLRSELSNYARDQVGKLQEIPIEFYCEIPAPEIAPIDEGLWRVIEDNLTYKQFEAIQFRNQGYTNREIAKLCGVGRKAIEKRFARIRKILSDYKEN